jgi:hypothetical protein
MIEAARRRSAHTHSEAEEPERRPDPTLGQAGSSAGLMAECVAGARELT